MDLSGLELAISYIIENACVEANISFLLKNVFVDYKTHLVGAYKCLYSAIQLSDKVVPLMVRTEAIVSVDPVTKFISLDGGNFTPEEGRKIVRRLTRLRCKFWMSKIHYGWAKEKENILNENNVSFIGESDMFNFTFEDKFQITESLLAITGVIGK